MTDTIFALATPPGRSGIAVIRVSGPGTKATLAALSVPLPAPRVATLATLKSSFRRKPESQADKKDPGLRRDDEIIDAALILYFPAPASFTGEDVIEYHVHGSRAVIQKILAVFSALPGLRAAEPGEFARRAFLNGKMDLTAAEGLADLINAETESQRRQALRLMQGEAARFYDALRESVLHSLALLEAHIDFPDEEIPANVLSEIAQETDTAIAGIESQLAGAGSGERIRDGVHVAILGPPNVGKSSLLNLLAKRDVAIVSGTPGTTRDVIEVHLDLAGYAVLLADTAGLRDAVDAVEKEGMLRARERAQKADIKIVMLDKESVTGGRWTVDGEITDHHSPATIHGLIDSSTLLVLNKSDLGLPSPLPSVAGQTPIPISVRDRTGIDGLLKTLEARVVAACPAESSLVTQARHRAHLAAALAHLKSYRASAPLGLELRCEELRRAATEIGKITGRISAEELLGHIFSRFCIGK